MHRLSGVASSTISDSLRADKNTFTVLMVNNIAIGTGLNVTDFTWLTSTEFAVQVFVSTASFITE